MKRLNVNISDEQYEALGEIAKAHVCTVADILGVFVADLTGVNSTGSDEQEKARAYFERTHLFEGWLRWLG